MRNAEVTVKCRSANSDVTSDPSSVALKIVAISNSNGCLAITNTIMYVHRLRRVDETRVTHVFLHADG